MNGCLNWQKYYTTITARCHPELTIMNRSGLEVLKGAGEDFEEKVFLARA